MATKSDFFNENNGRYYLCENESRITCELKQSWSLAKMQEAVADWQARVDHQIAYEKWEKQLIEYAIAQGYSSDEVRMGSFTGEPLFSRYQDDLAGAFDRLKTILSLHVTDLQQEVVKQLQPSETDRHVRLYKNGRIAVGGSNGCWHEVQRDGTFPLIETDPIPETKLYLHRALIDVDSNILIAVDVFNVCFQASICYDKQTTDKWHRVNISQILSGSCAHPVRMDITGDNIDISLG
jgi:hypothetical protein